MRRRNWQSSCFELKMKKCETRKFLSRLESKPPPRNLISTKLISAKHHLSTAWCDYSAVEMEPWLLAYATLAFVRVTNSLQVCHVIHGMNWPQWARILNQQAAVLNEKHQLPFITQVKEDWAWIVLGRETAWELQLLQGWVRIQTLKSNVIFAGSR